MSICYGELNDHVNSTLSLTANGTTNASTAVIGDHSFFTQIGTCTNAAYGIVLPKHPELGRPYMVKNDGAHMATVFPHSSGSSSTVDGGASFVLGNNGCEASFVAKTSSPLTANAEDIVWHSFGKSGKAVIAASGDITLQTCPHYDVLVNITQSSAYTITLPSPASANNGMRVVCNLSVIGAFTVDVQGGAAGKVQGIVLQDSDTGTQCDHVEGAAQLSIDFDNGCVVGDRIELVSDAVLWKAIGFSSAVDKMTFTA